MTTFRSMQLRSSRLAVLFALVLLAGTFAGKTHPARAATPQDFLVPNPGFPVILPSGPVKFGSVTLADINGDGHPDILVGGSDGVVSAVSSDGKLLWQFHTDAAINAMPGVHPSGTTIRSAPAVADIDGDGTPEIIVSVGDIFEVHQNGAVIALHADGTLVSGWPQLTMDRGGAGPTLALPDGFTDGVVSSPAVADLFGDGHKEIIYGAFDQMVYVKRADGSDLPGWPKFVRDTVWSSPAVADLNGDGHKAIIIGIDAHQDPFYGDLNGGYVKVYNPDGTEVPGWPQHEDDAVYSSPAVADLLGDGKLEIVVGSSGYYGKGKHVTAYRSDGTLLWRAPTTGVIGNSPVIGDITGNGRPDVVVISDDPERKLYAWDGATGTPLAHFPMTPTSIYGAEATGGVLLGDVEGRGINDILAVVGGQVAVIRGTDGAQLTANTNPPGSKPVFDAGWTMDSTPALGDLNGDGKLALVTAAANGPAPQGLINAWTLPTSSRTAAWPMFRGEPNHSGQLISPQLVTSPSIVSTTQAPGTKNTYPITISSTSDTPLAWTVSVTDTAHLVAYTVTRNTIQLTVSAPSASGRYQAAVVVQAAGLAPKTIPISVLVKDETVRVYVPLVGSTPRVSPYPAPPSAKPRR